MIRPNPASTANRNRLATEAVFLGVVPDAEDQAEETRDWRNASPIRGALIGLLPSLALWAVALLLAAGAGVVIVAFLLGPQW